MLTTSQRDFLEKLFPGEQSVFEPEAVKAYGVDSSRAFAAPWAVVRPEKKEQIEELLKFAQAERLAVYPRARGTSRVGGAVPALGGIVVSLLHFDRILDVNAEDFVADVEPGVVTADLQKACAAKRLYFPPDPASVRYSTVGGNVSTCAGGMRAIKYGVTRDYVLGLEAVLPGGRSVRFGGRCHKDVAGLDLARLFAGSGGTLGIVTRLFLKLLPLPEAQASLMAAFESLEAALAAIRHGFAAGILPASLEFMDNAVLEALTLGGPVPWPAGTGAVLLYRLDGSPAGVAAELDRLGQALDPAKPLLLATAATPEAEEGLWDLRRQVSQALFRLAPDKTGEDVAVPRGSLARAVAAFRAEGQRHGIRVACFGHLGDGNIHVNMLYDAKDPDQAERSRLCKEGIYRAALDLGGTLSGEHGLGLTKGPYLDWQIPPVERGLMRAVKQVFDPQGIMNPGKEWG